MKKNYLLLAFLCAALSTRAQNIMFNYQAVARDLNNQPYKTTPAEAMTVGISIVDDNKKELYSEDFENVATSQLGIFNLLIGTGKNKAGKLEDIDWTASKPLFLAATIKLGNSFEKSLPQSQLVYVPFSIFAVTADNLKDPVGGDLSGPYRNAQLNSEVVGTLELVNEAVTNGKIAGEAVTSEKIKNGEVKTEDLANRAVTNSKLGLNCVNDSTIADQTITYTKLKTPVNTPNGMVLKSSGDAWVLGVDNDTPVTAGSGISIKGNMVSAVDSSSSNEIQNLNWDASNSKLSITQTPADPKQVTLTAGGDVSGNLNALKLASSIDVGTSGLTLSGGPLIVNGSARKGDYESPSKPYVRLTKGPQVPQKVYFFKQYGFLMNSGFANSKFDTLNTNIPAKSLEYEMDSIRNLTGSILFPIYTATPNTNLSILDPNSRYSIWAKQKIICPEFNATSDLRIKHIIGTSHRQQDRVALEKIAVRDFYYKDVVAHGTQSKKGFIAQEV